LALELLPNIILNLFSFFAPIKGYKILKALYDLFKNYVTALSTGLFFYLTFNLWQEKFKAKNELSNILIEYKEMKKDVLEEMLLAESDPYGNPKIDELCEELCLNPQAASDYFTEEIFFKTCENLDENRMRNIRFTLRLFLDDFHNAKNESLKNGSSSLAIVYKDIAYILQKLTEEIPFYWEAEQSCPSNHPLYILFCYKNEKYPNKDIRYHLISEEYEKLS